MRDVTTQLRAVTRSTEAKSLRHFAPAAISGATSETTASEERHAAPRSIASAAQAVKSGAFGGALGPHGAHCSPMSSKRSAGILLFRHAGDALEVLLVHPGGPFWSKKDDGAWFVPKGELEAGEEPFAAALREFREELGSDAPSGEPLALGFVKNKSGKMIHAWALEGELDVQSVKSNTFSLEWPPRSGQLREFPEVDRASFFSLDEAARKIHAAELPFLERLTALRAG